MDGWKEKIMIIVNGGCLLTCVTLSIVSIRLYLSMELSDPRFGVIREGLPAFIGLMIFFAAASAGLLFRRIKRLVRPESIQDKDNLESWP